MTIRAFQKFAEAGVHINVVQLPKSDRCSESVVKSHDLQSAAAHITRK
jgi:hypothetical protein